mmetsp:Transcript_1460/g.4141  ORF Transcript_1460/g.4141 Transcript_1460/m.4141 type:complete len:496 (-) Transcript_1460:32-1519(-)
MPTNPLAETDEEEQRSSGSLQEPLLASEPPPPKAAPVALGPELKDLAGLTAAYFVSSVSWVAMKATDTALLGHVGTRYLDATALSDLYTSSTGVFVQGRVLGVFVSQAVGAGNKALAGAWLQTSYCVLGCVLAPVAAAWACTGPALKLLGVSNGQLRSDAAYYALVLAACLPARVGFSQITQFFSAQKIMRPAYSTAPFSMVLNLVLGLIFVLGVAIPGWRGFGFAACPIVTTAVEYVQLAIVFGVFCCAKQLHAPCEPENGWWSLAEVTSERVREYAKMYVPAALSIASDFWRMSAVGAVAASLGKDDLGVFNASYRLMWMALTLTGSLGGAVATKLGLRLGAGDHLGARQGVIVGLTVACGVLVLISLLVIAIPEELAKIFTEDSKLIETFAGCRYEFAAALFTMNFAVVCERVPFGMGRARAVLVAGGLGSWAGQVPAVLLAVNFWQRSLKAVYAGVAAGYCLLIVLLLGIIATTDWKRQALEARARSEASG